MLPRKAALHIGERVPRGAERQAQPASHGAIEIWTGAAVRRGIKAGEGPASHSTIRGQPSGVGLKPVDPISVLPVVTDLATEAVTRRRRPVAKNGGTKRI